MCNRTGENFKTNCFWKQAQRESVLQQCPESSRMIKSDPGPRFPGSHFSINTCLGRATFFQLLKNLSSLRAGFLPLLFRQRLSWRAPSGQSSRVERSSIALSNLVKPVWSKCLVNAREALIFLYGFQLFSHLKGTLLAYHFIGFVSLSVDETSLIEISFLCSVWPCFL